MIHFSNNFTVKYLSVLFLFLLLFLHPVTAQTVSDNYPETLTEASPEAAGMSSESLKRIEDMLQQAIKEQEIPGAVALVARDGQIIMHKAFGKADASGRELEKDDIFRIASQTKAITATAVMMLWEEGEFRLDDPISRYIPEFKNPQVLETFNESDSSYTTRPADKEITIRHLLTHTSGLGYGMIDNDERMRKIYQKEGVLDLFTTSDVTIEENIRKLGKLPLHHDPGEKFTYSEGLDVLGYFIEVISEKPFDEFLQERIFDPLNMKDTYFYLPPEKADRLVAVQYKKDEKWKNYPETFYDPDYPVKGAKSFFSGGAGLVSTAKDYATFLQMYLNNGELNGKRILSRTTVESIMGNQTGELWGTPDKYYGLAFAIVTPKGQEKGGLGSAGTFDWGGYFNTQYFADPEEQLIGILLKQTQQIANDNTGWKFRQMVISAVND